MGDGNIISGRAPSLGPLGAKGCSPAEALEPGWILGLSTRTPLMTSTSDQTRSPSRESVQTPSSVQDPARPVRAAQWPDLAQVPRELGRVVGQQPGPTLICLGGLHGNEPAGVLGIQRILAKLARGRTQIRGELVGLAGNRGALAVGHRFVDHDLNRAWRSENLARLLKTPGPLETEDREQVELDAALQQTIQESTGRVFLLDLHTTSGPGPAFAILDDTLPNREVALDLPVPLVLGLEEELSGTLASYLTASGVTVVGFEAGQHEDPGSVDRAEAAIWLAMESCGLLQEEYRDRLGEARRLLRSQVDVSIGIVEVLHRHSIETGDVFEMAPGFRSFQAVAQGQLLGRNASGAVLAPFEGLLLMPLYQEQGGDGFFLVRRVQPIWLPISAGLRRWRLERLLLWLPGISRHPDRVDTFLVDQRYARLLALRAFHLLGFRREGRKGRFLVMQRR